MTYNNIINYPQADVAVMEPRGRTTGDVWIGGAADLAWAAARSAGLLDRVSFVAVDDTGHVPDLPPLRALLEHLPGHKWGQSVLWTPAFGKASDQVLQAYAERPAMLRVGEAVFGCKVRYDVERPEDVAARVVSYAEKYPRLSLLVFADESEALREALARSDLVSDRLGKQLNAWNRIEVAPNRQSWSSRDTVDVVLHADAPPSREERRPPLSHAVVQFHSLIISCTHRSYTSY